MFIDLRLKIIVWHNDLAVYWLRFGMGTATSWGGIGYVLGWVRLRFGMA